MKVRVPELANPAKGRIAAETELAQQDLWKRLIDFWKEAPKMVLDPGACEDDELTEFERQHYRTYPREQPEWLLAFEDFAKRCFVLRAEIYLPEFSLPEKYGRFLRQRVQPEIVSRLRDWAEVLAQTRREAGYVVEENFARTVDVVFQNVSQHVQSRLEFWSRRCQALAEQWRAKETERISGTIDRCRKAHGWTFEKLAEEATVDVTQIYRMKRGEAVRPEIRKKLSDCLKCSIEEISPSPPPPLSL